jgi:hypothetical protein
VEVAEEDNVFIVAKLLLKKPTVFKSLTQLQTQAKGLQEVVVNLVLQILIITTIIVKIIKIQTRNKKIIITINNNINHFSLFPSLPIQSLIATLEAALLEISAIRKKCSTSSRISSKPGSPRSTRAFFKATRLNNVFFNNNSNNQSKPR